MMSSTEMKQRSPSADTPAKAAVEAAQSVPPHVLALDDDPDLRDLLREFLPKHDLRTTTVATGTEMLRVLEQEPVDILLIDLRLPHEDGLALARKVRERSAIPIIILTGKTDEADRVMGLELAADDYVTKPFSPRELVARIRAQLRRAQQDKTSEAANPRAYRFAGWELNLRRRRLTSPTGDPVELTNSEFNLLCAFLAAPQRVQTRDQLLERSRLHSLEVYDRAIDVTILRLRRKIEVDYTDPQLIVTERGAGYVFTQPVSVLR
jgi:two-component system OmpR family response regulator